MVVRTRVQLLQLTVAAAALANTNYIHSNPRSRCTNGDELVMAAMQTPMLLCLLPEYGSKEAAYDQDNHNCKT